MTLVRQIPVWPESFNAQCIAKLPDLENLRHSVHDTSHEAMPFSDSLDLPMDSILLDPNGCCYQGARFQIEERKLNVRFYST